MQKIESVATLGGHAYIVVTCRRASKRFRSKNREIWMGICGSGTYSWLMIKPPGERPSRRETSCVVWPGKKGRGGHLTAVSGVCQ